MNYDQFLTRGLEGRELWQTLRTKCVSHHGVLQEMRARQEQLSAYAKMGVSEGPRINGVDQIQGSLLKDIQFLETMAWRMYMFGSRQLFSPKPGADGEFYRRMRNDAAYHKLRDRQLIELGETGCEYERTIFASVNPLALITRPCLRPKCPHRAIKKCVKWLKREIRQEWERTILRRYKY